MSYCGGSTGGGSKNTSGAEETLDIYSFELKDLNSNPFTIFYKKNRDTRGLFRPIYWSLYTQIRGIYN
jgi:hypothetical protein